MDLHRDATAGRTTTIPSSPSPPKAVLPLPPLVSPIDLRLREFIRVGVRVIAGLLLDADARCEFGDLAMEGTVEELEGAELFPILIKLVSTSAKSIPY